MNRKAARCIVILAAALALATPLSVLADDSAASIAAGGLVPRRETRIVMAKEVLRISPKKVVVDYDFRNDSDEDVITEVAFPIPPYKNEFPNGSASEQAFQSFKLWVDGKPAHYESEAKATLKGLDVTRILNENHIDIPTFGHFDDSSTSGVVLVPDFSRLPKTAQTRLLKNGLFDDEGSIIFSHYTVHLQYHWTQTFPAHSAVHIRHEYSPVLGFTQVSSAVDDLLTQVTTGHHTAAEDSDGIKLLSDFCPDKAFLSAVSRHLRESEFETAYPEWVDFILTTANTWKTPIEDFTLIIERGRPLDGYGKPIKDRQRLISFCSPQNTKVEKLDADHFQVHLTNFVPTSELHIGFFDVPDAKPAPKK
jgi:Domain of unknown function (DUF4424)